MQREIIVEGKPNPLNCAQFALFGLVREVWSKLSCVQFAVSKWVIVSQIGFFLQWDNKQDTKSKKSGGEKV